MSARTAFWTTLLQPPRAMCFPFTLGAYSPASNLLTGSGLTLEFWVYVEAYANPPGGFTGSENRQLLVLSRGSAGYAFFCALSQQKLQFYSYSNGAQLVQTQATLPAQTWHHVAIVHTSGTVSVYVDGSPAPLQGQPGHQAPMGALYPVSAWALGHNDSYRINEALYGKLDEFRLWNTPRDAAQINAAYQLSNSAILLSGATDLLACYDFNEQAYNSSMFIRDGSGNNLHLGSSTNVWENDSALSTAPLLR